jgi:predicted nucleotidyltransferase
MLEHNVLNYLNEKYKPSLIILYGSYYTNTFNFESDIDLILYAPVPEFIHDSSIINEVQLDAWIYPEKEKIRTEKLIHILPCEIIKDDNNIGRSLILKIEKFRDKTIKEMSDSERIQLNSWIDKMLNRAKENTIEANYRYNWLLHELPELYCQIRNQYYNGPIKTLKRIKDENLDKVSANNRFNLTRLCHGSCYSRPSFAGERSFTQEPRHLTARRLSVCSMDAFGAEVKMKILFTSDIHEDLVAYDRFVYLLKERNYDIGIISGDLMEYDLTIKEMESTPGVHSDDLLEELYDPEDSIDDLNERVIRYRKNRNTPLYKTIKYVTRQEPRHLTARRLSVC